MGQVVAGEAAVELGEAPAISAALSRCDAVDQPVDRADPVGPRLRLRQLIVIERRRAPDGAVEQHGRQLQHMVARLAVEARALAAGVGADHAADGGAVRGRQLGREEQAVLASAALSWSLTTPASTRTQRSAALISRMRFMWRDRSTTRPSVSDWPLVPVPPPRGASLSAGEARLAAAVRAMRTRSSVCLRKGDRLRLELIDRVVGREHRAIGVVRGLNRPSKPRARSSARNATCSGIGPELSVRRGIMTIHRANAADAHSRWYYSLRDEDTSASNFS